MPGSVATATTSTSSSSFSDSDVRKLQEELDGLRVKYKNASEELDHARYDLETLSKEKKEADRLRDAPNEAAQKEIESLKSRLETTKCQLNDKKDELDIYESKNRAMNIQVQESLKEHGELENKNAKLMADLKKTIESSAAAKNELEVKVAEVNAIHEELSNAKSEIKSLKDELKSSKDKLTKKMREAESLTSVVKGADAVKDQLAQKDKEIAKLEQKICDVAAERETESKKADEKLAATENEMAGLKARLEELNEENMKLINDIAEALNAAGNEKEAKAVKEKAAAARAAAPDAQIGVFGQFRRRMTGEFGVDVEDSSEEEDEEPVVADLDDAIKQLKEKNAKIKELEEAADEHEEALLALKSDLVRLNASYKDDDYLNKKNIERLRQENTMYAMQIQRMEQELAEYREMYQ